MNKTKTSEQMNENITGYLEVILGPMFSGKTSRLLEIYRKYKGVRGKNVVVINHYTDDRYGENTELYTHSRDKIPCLPLKQLKDFEIPKNEPSNQTVLLINEGQFFTDVDVMVPKFVEEYNMRVFVCGLDGDFRRRKIGNIMNLIPYADNITKLTSLCRGCNGECGKPALFTHRVSKETEQVVIGSDNYIPLCRKCYNSSN